MIFLGTGLLISGITMECCLISIVCTCIFDLSVCQSVCPYTHLMAQFVHKLDIFVHFK